MIRYPVGASEVKLFPVAPSPANTARVADAVGVRLLTFFYRRRGRRHTAIRGAWFSAPPSSGGPLRTQALAPRRSCRIRTANGSSSSSFRARRPTRSSASRSALRSAILRRAARFTASVMGLAPQPPVRDELLGTVKHPFKHGNTTINLWSFGADLPKDSATGGIQYIVWNVAAIDARRAGARCGDRSAVVGARADADAVAVGSRRRQQLLRGVRRQRQLAGRSVIDGEPDVRAVLGAHHVVVRRRGRQCERRLAVGPQAVEIEVRVQRVELRRPCAAAIWLASAARTIHVRPTPRIVAAEPGFGEVGG